jgi:hypothetical protein
MSFEHSTFTSPARSLPPGAYAQDAWRQGMELSTIASSDDHRAHPGQPHLGLAAVQAPALTRNDIFQALYDRHTYGTDRGQDHPPIHAERGADGLLGDVRRGARIERAGLGHRSHTPVDLLKHQPPDRGFEVIHSWRPDQLDFAGPHRDEGFQPGAGYYVRLEQRHTSRGRAVMAWSSPIWTSK